MLGVRAGEAVAFRSNIQRPGDIVVSVNVMDYMLVNVKLTNNFTNSRHGFLILISYKLQNFYDSIQKNYVTFYKRVKYATSLKFTFMNTSMVKSVEIVKFNLQKIRSSLGSCRQSVDDENFNGSDFARGQTTGPDLLERRSKLQLICSYAD